ncbi:hypothetical protein BKM09_013645 [Pseudomonas amygdali pv. morsprunorum]|nr:hypothetical protein BKM19_029945 [Pseudomonas amygdali pv. morsprunorum]KAA3532727.1 hypothetical protein DXU85_28585 [Pseudomonas savastanoi]POY79732.1 hypothetical protein BKM09_013645 [Pseudomonas amygdali pv. morsprunorum]TSC26454.1 hypothetical protein FOM00_28740 [Pseudomonas sp. ST1]
MPSPTTSTSRRRSRRQRQTLCIGISKCLCVAACNRNGLDLQSSHFSTGFNCVYPSQQTEIICELTCIHLIRPAIDRHEPELAASERTPFLSHSSTPQPGVRLPTSPLSD